MDDFVKEATANGDLPEEDDYALAAKRASAEREAKSFRLDAPANMLNDSFNLPTPTPQHSLECL